MMKSGNEKHFKKLLEALKESQNEKQTDYQLNKN